jgi:GAF domain-containing protein
MKVHETQHTTEKSGNWLGQIWGFLTSPHPSVEEIGERRRAQLLATIASILTGTFILALISGPTSGATFFILIIVSMASYLLSRTEYYVVGSYFFSYALTSVPYLTLYLGTASGFESAIASTAYAAIIVASILLPVRGLVLLVILASIATFAAPYYSQASMPAEGAMRVSGVFMSIGLILIGANVFRTWIEKARLKEVHEVNRRLEDLASNLEQRVNERTAEIEKMSRQTARRAAQLKAVTGLSESIAQLQNLNEIFPATTKLISERFDFYHVGIFIVDQDRQYAVLQAANSEGGKRMLKRNHRLQLGVGVVGFCAQTGQPRIALDVGADAVYFNNPDLPTTRSEVALPIKARGETIGVLDVQSTEAGAFSSEDLEVLTTLANQVSIALENARLLTEARAAYTQMQEVYNEFTRAEWSRTISQVQQPGFRYQVGRIEMLQSPLQSQEIVAAAQQGEIVAKQPIGSSEKRPAIAVPVKLRGEVIGILHIQSNDSSREWQEDDISLLQAVAERAAFAMENARLFQDARRRAAKERLISEATARISGAFNVENILQTTAEELERVLGGSEILIQFQSKERS